MYTDLIAKFSALEEQPVRVFTDDGRAVAGIVLAVGEQGVRLIERRGDIVWIEYAHVASVQEPQMRLLVRKAPSDCHE